MDRDAESGSLAWAALLGPHRLAIAALLGLSLAASALVLAQPWLTKQLIDEGLIARDFGSIVASAGLIFLAGFAGSVLGGINRYYYTRVSARILFALRERVFAHLLRLSPAWFARQRGGDLLARLDGDVAEIQRFAVDGLFAGVSGVFGLIGTVALMLLLSPALTLLALLLLPVQWFYLRRMRPRVQERVRGVRERAADISSFLVEMLPAIKLVQGLATGARETLRLRQLNHAYLGGLLNLQLTEFATAAVPATLTSAVRAAVFIAGGYLVVDGRMGVGALIAFSTYLGMATGPVQSLLGVYMGLGRVRVSIERVELLSAAAPDVVDAGGLPPPDHADIHLEDAGFRYPVAPGAPQDDAAAWVFRHVTLHLPAGSKIGVHGPSGAGKTSLADLLLRHYDPAEGCVRIGGHDLRTLGLAGWRRRVALVSQDTVLFRGSLADNIRYAAPEADAAAIEEAARRAGLGDLIEHLPDGLDTPVGDRGTRLSGGERQRVAIARALLCSPVLVICDEATSAVDADTEALIIRSIDTLFAAATRIVISHRDAPLRDVDLLLYVADGGIRTGQAGA